ncbi:MAG: hypothetical protein J6V90_03480 [Treponema sp.]|nr:hypothetical protein [Treponema sp.]
MKCFTLRLTARFLIERKMSATFMFSFRVLAKWLRKNMGCADVFLLCFENVLEGETCHRRWLAKILHKSFGLKIEEWRG